MLSLLVSHDAIAEAQGALEAVLRREFAQTEYRDITYPSGRAANSEVWTDASYWYRHAFLDTRKRARPGH